MSPNPQSAFQLLVVALALMTVLVLVILLYLRGWWRLRVARPKAISRWQLGVFMCGMIALGTAVGSALAALDHQLLLMHMILHILLMAIAPPLILLGAPYLVFAQALPASFILAVDPILRWRPMQRLENFLVKPLLCGFIATAVLVGWHFPAAFDFGMKSGSRHAIECASFFAAGIFFWKPVIQLQSNQDQSSRWLTPLYLFLATLPCDALSAFLTFCGRVVYHHYLHVQRSFNISALQDQQYAGALMWVSVTFIYLIPAVVITIQILSPSSTHRRAISADHSTGLD